MKQMHFESLLSTVPRQRELYDLHEDFSLQEFGARPPPEKKKSKSFLSLYTSTRRAPFIMLGLFSMATL